MERLPARGRASPRETFGSVEMIDGNHPRRQVAELGERARLVLAEDALGLGLGDPIVVVVALHLALANGALELLVGVLGGDGLFQGVFEQADLVVRVLGDEHASRQAVAELTRLEHGAGDDLALLVGGLTAPDAEGEHQRPHQHASPPHREIVERTGERLVEAGEAIPRAIIDELEIGARAAVVLVALQDAGQQIKLGERVGHAPGDLLLGLEPAAEQHHGHVGDEGEGARGAGKLAPPAARGAGVRRRAGKGAERQVVEQGAEQIRDGKGEMAVEGALEGGDALLLVGVLQRLDLGEEVGVAAERALGEGDQGAGEDVGAFDGDADRHHLIGALDVVRRPVADASAAMDVEGVIDALAHALGRDVFQQRRDHRRLLARGHHRGGDGARGFEPVSSSPPCGRAAPRRPP